MSGVVVVDPHVEIDADREPLARAFFSRPGPIVARELLGTLLLRSDEAGVTGGVIVETEAYGGSDDAASHARAGSTRRTATMFGPPGHAYVYRIYGLHWCLNVVTEEPGQAGAVLIRALLPTVGSELMRHRRGRPADRLERLCAGPARICQALAIDGGLDGHDLTTGHRLWMVGPPAAETSDETREEAVLIGPRVGVDYAGASAARRWRFGSSGSPALSRPFRPGSATDEKAKRP